MNLKKAALITRAALKEDVGRGDVTTRLCVPRDEKGKAVIVFKQAGIVCGLEVAKLTFRLVDSSIRFKALVKDGNRVCAGRTVARIEGPLRSILTGERVSLNFLAHLSGIATRTAEYVKRVRGYKVKIMDTRKTTPGLRYLEKYAVRAGGGSNHRMGLYDQVLIKDNHLGLESQMIQTLTAQAKKRAPKGMKIEVEVGSLSQFKQALEARPDIIMLDNMSIKSVRQAVKIRNHFIGRRPLLEVSGRITLGNVRDVARAGVDMISIGELTHSVRSIDMALEMA